MALRRPLVLIVLALALLAAMMLGSGLGAVRYAPGALLEALFHPHAKTGAAPVLWELRLPRVLIATLVGAALAVAGTLLQGVLRNPIADPYLTGASAGAAFAIALSIALGVPPAAYASVAFIAALGTVVIVALLSKSGTGLSTERLVLAGISVSALFAAMTTVVILFTPSSAVSLNILGWLGGSLGGHGWNDLGLAALYALAGFALALVTVPALNAMRLGQKRAESLGVDVDRTRWIVITASALLTAAAVSVSGIIGFVGLIVPHVVRAAIGTDLRWTVLASIPAGAIIVVLADTLARTIAPPLELPVGILLSILGVPAFLYLASRTRYAAP